MPTGNELSNYIQRLTIGQGRHAGEPFKLLAWQKRFLRGAFKSGVGDAALSIARANGKSVLIAAIGSAAIDIDAPLVEPMGECLIVASTFQQGGIILCLSHKFAANCRGDDRYGIELTISAIDVIPSGF